MKKDNEVRLLLRTRAKGVSQEAAAARSGMSVRSAYKYETLGGLPSQVVKPRTHRTRFDPFAEDWPWVESELERDPALQATTLFSLLCESHPGHYQPIQLRTLQRHILTWRIQHGPEREVMFEQVHEPGQIGQSDFTAMDPLGITLGGIAFPHLVFHLVLTYSNVEAIRICFSESFEALAEGIEACLWQIGGVPAYHRTDNLSAAIHRLSKEERRAFTRNYEGLMAHYGMQPTRNTPGESHQNGDVEQAHHRFKVAVDQALRVRGSREFTTRSAYASFLNELVRRRNLTRERRFEIERERLKPLPACREVKTRVTRFSTIHVLGKCYSVPSRLIRADLKVRVRAEILELYYGAALVLTLPRLRGQHKHRIDYRHVIWSLVRKPGAFANYRFREELYPTTVAG